VDPLAVATTSGWTSHFPQKEFLVSIVPESLELSRKSSSGSPSSGTISTTRRPSFLQLTLFLPVSLFWDAHFFAIALRHFLITHCNTPKYNHQQHAKCHSPQPTPASLTEADRETTPDWLRANSYDAVPRRVRKRARRLFGLYLPKSRSKTVLRQGPPARSHLTPPYSWRRPVGKHRKGNSPLNLRKIHKRRRLHLARRPEMKTSLSTDHESSSALTDLARFCADENGNP